MMIFMDIGGGMRDIYGAGVFDRLIDEKIRADHVIGVSAGSANVCSFITRQRSRNFRFYHNYAQRKEYMSVGNFLKDGNYIDLKYIYGDISQEGGEDPFDVDKCKREKTGLTIVCTDAETGLPAYFGKEELSKTDLWLLMATCSLPIMGQPTEHDGRKFYDGGISDPIPVEKALELGADFIMCIIPKVVTYKNPMPLKYHALDEYPMIRDDMTVRARVYNQKLDKLKELEKQGRALIVSPDGTEGLNMVSRNPKKLENFYNKGYNDVGKYLDILRNHMSK